MRRDVCNGRICGTTRAQGLAGGPPQSEHCRALPGGCCVLRPRRMRRVLTDGLLPIRDADASAADVEPAAPRDDTTPSTKIFMRNLSYTIDETKLNKFFEGTGGSVVDIHWMRDSKSGALLWTPFPRQPETPCAEPAVASMAALFSCVRACRQIKSTPASLSSIASRRRPRLSRWLGRHAPAGQPGSVSPTPRTARCVDRTVLCVARPRGCCVAVAQSCAPWWWQSSSAKAAGDEWSEGWTAPKKDSKDAMPAANNKVAWAEDGDDDAEESEADDESSDDDDESDSD